MTKCTVRTDYGSAHGGDIKLLFVPTPPKSGGSVMLLKAWTAVPPDAPPMPSQLDSGRLCSAGARSGASWWAMALNTPGGNDTSRTTIKPAS